MRSSLDGLARNVAQQRPQHTPRCACSCHSVCHRFRSPFMKFLSDFLQSHSENALNLISLSSEARDSGLRDEKATIHEFIDTLERITSELRSDPNATAFLSRVKKTDAPDYYDIIKKPMDLGTVLKKVKSGVYKTKASFNDDLELIWTNCFTYNSTINHHLRTAAEALRTRAQNMLKFVSEPDLNGPLTNGPSKPINRSASTGTPRASFSHPSSASLVGLKLAEKRWRLSERGLEATSGDPIMENSNSPLPQLSSHQPIAGPSKTKADPIRVDLPWEDREALLRQPDMMWDWFTDKEDEPLEMIEPELLMTALPALPFAPQSTRRRRDLKKERDRDKVGQDGPQGLSKPIETNVKNLWEIKRIHRKISDLVAGHSFRYETGTDPIPEDEERAKTSGLDGDDSEDEQAYHHPQKNFQNLPPPEIYQTNLASLAARQAMRRIVSLMITHVGFDATHSGALNCLTDIAIQYLSNIGRTLHFYADRFSRALSTSEMIYQALRANGVGELDELEGYVKDDVDKYGVKLNDLLRKLQTGYGNGLAGTVSKVFGDDDLFAKDGEALVTGEFTNELGEDFFGLRDLGLDSELGLTSLKIPSNLLYGRPKVDTNQSLAQELQNKPAPEPRFVKPVEFIPLKPEWIGEQIAILQPVYLARAEVKEFGLKDDDQVSRLPKVFRPKVPPSGKIPVKRRTTSTMSTITPSGGNSLPPCKKQRIEDGADLITVESDEKFDAKSNEKEERSG
ncbi:hypothetical protein O181_010618 [Austropuccinia psidii MF-1]|uniref:Bromo domain-containing protein n=1 Tax=Austropuccinia psidii MF-1 TaxID=1389203 RepID=A0A9Q3GKJ1_9BASI|nr:hypothetical protein [Austropuccinia psidii MF-1]